jgi:hypothetical protein
MNSTSRYIDKGSIRVVPPSDATGYPRIQYSPDESLKYAVEEQEDVLCLKDAALSIINECKKVWPEKEERAKRMKGVLYIPTGVDLKKPYTVVLRSTRFSRGEGQKNFPVFSLMVQQGSSKTFSGIEW